MIFFSDALDCPSKSPICLSMLKSNFLWIQCVRWISREKTRLMMSKHRQFAFVVRSRSQFITCWHCRSSLVVASILSIIDQEKIHICLRISANESPSMLDKGKGILYIFGEVTTNKLIATFLWNHQKLIIGKKLIRFFVKSPQTTFFTFSWNPLKTIYLNKFN